MAAGQVDPVPGPLHAVAGRGEPGFVTAAPAADGRLVGGHRPSLMLGIVFLRCPEHPGGNHLPVEQPSSAAASMARTSSALDVGAEQLGAGFEPYALGERSGDDRVEAEGVDERRDGGEVGGVVTGDRDGLAPGRARRAGPRPRDRGSPCG